MAQTVKIALVQNCSLFALRFFRGCFIAGSVFFVNLLASANLFLSMRNPLLLILAAVFVIGCGTPGAPQPPSLRLPKPVEDLKAVRQGDKVYLSFTAPSKTTDEAGIRLPGTARICRNFRVLPSETCSNVVAELPSPAGPAEQKLKFVDDLSSMLKNNRQDYVTYNVEVANELGRTAGPSNAVTVFLAPSLLPARDLTATLKEDGVTLQWTGVPQPPAGNLQTRFLYRVLRSVKAAETSSGEDPPAAVLVGERPATAGMNSLRDKNFQWEKQYTYRVVGVTQVLSRDGRILAEFEGDAAPAAEIVAHDVFAPAPPKGVQAVFSGVPERPSIDLTWSPADEDDIAGYHVYRHEGSAVPERITTDTAKTPAFRDANVQLGKTYFYSVTAVDARGNQSKPSAETSEKVPE